MNSHDPLRHTRCILKKSRSMATPIFRDKDGGPESFVACLKSQLAGRAGCEARYL